MIWRCKRADERKGEVGTPQIAAAAAAATITVVASMTANPRGSRPSRPPVALRSAAPIGSDHFFAGPAAGPPPGAHGRQGVTPTTPQRCARCTAVPLRGTAPQSRAAELPTTRHEGAPNSAPRRGPGARPPSPVSLHRKGSPQPPRSCPQRVAIGRRIRTTAGDRARGTPWAVAAIVAAAVATTAAR